MKLYQVPLTSISRSRRRSVLTVLAVAFSVAGSLMISSLALNYEQVQNGVAQTFPNTILVLQRDTSLREFLPFGSNLNQSLGPSIAAVPGVAYVSPVLVEEYNSSVTGVSDPFLPHAVMGISPTASTLLGLGLRQGSLPTGPGQALVGYYTSVAHPLSPGDNIQLRNRNFTVSGVLQTTVPVLDRLIILDYGAVQSLYGAQGRASFFVVVPAAESSPSQVASGIEAISPNIVALTDAAREQQSNAILYSVLVVNDGVATTSFLVAAVVVGMVMMLSFSERRREFALLKVVGASPRSIGAMVLLESFILVALATAAGGLMGFGGTLVLLRQALINSQHLTLGYLWSETLIVFNPGTVATGVAVTLLAGLPAGLYPAYRAIRMPSAPALNAD